MSAQKRKKIGDLLVEAGAISEVELQEALVQKDSAEKIGDFLIRKQLITSETLENVLKQQLSIESVHLMEIHISEQTTRLITRDLAKRLNCIPYKLTQQQLYVAMEDPMDYFAIEEIRMATGYQVVPVLAMQEDLYMAINKYYDLNESITAVMSDLSIQVEEDELFQNDSPMVKLVEQIITSAVMAKASDIHFESLEHELRVRFRIDGMLRTERVLPKKVRNMVVSRLKVMANLNITETRLPQDGRITGMFAQQKVDIRLSTLPTMYGEKIVLRLLNLSERQLMLTDLHFSPQHLQQYLSLIQKPNGIVLLTGPTGSGKSTTLSATLSHLNNDQVNIVTIEDPIEYHVRGINQIQVREDLGLTFANGLRSILRQDPDIVMVGEIRDLETAQIAIRASLTGHLVLSTLHTNSAAETITRLIEMGVPAYLVGTALQGIVAQRLVRKICPKCKFERPINEIESKLFAQHHYERATVVEGRGCTTCNQSGYSGRLAIHEMLTITDEVKRALVNEHFLVELKEILYKEGQQTLLQDGLQKVMANETTVEEILRVVAQ